MPSTRRKRAHSVDRTNHQIAGKRKVGRQRVAKSTNKLFPLFSLPLEIREKIYEAFFRSKESLPNCHRKCSKDCKEHVLGSRVLLYVCRQVHAEAWPYYVSQQTFVFDHPKRMADDFLSFLPPQRLRSIKHLTLLCQEHTDLDTVDGKGVFMYLQLLWWRYLDVFSNLETFTIDCHDAWTLGKLVPLMIKLLEQGRPKKPQWIYARTSRYLGVATKGLPSSHDWVLDIGNIEKDVFNVNLGIFGRHTECNRILLRQHNVRRYQYLDLFAGWMSQPQNCIVEENKDGTIVRQNNYVWYTELSKNGSFLTVFPNTGLADATVACELQHHTRILNPGTEHLTSATVKAPEGRVHRKPVDIVSIGGRWINPHVDTQHTQR